MLSKIRVQNFKSIVDEQIELGTFNVFIGPNGVGKTNVLEAVGMAAAATIFRLTPQDLANSGIRIARPSLMANAFRATKTSPELKLSLFKNGQDEPSIISLVPENSLDHGSAWENASVKRMSLTIGPATQELSEAQREAVARQLLLLLSTHQDIEGFAIYSPSTHTLRGLSVASYKEPLGIYGENLDVTLANLPDADLAHLKEMARMVEWVDDFEVDPSDKYKFEGLKLGRSQSRLYFTDRFLDTDNRILSAENANEGILHVLFHLALMIAPGTPKIFAVDNLETALNPGMCRALTKALAQLATERGKQALVTTHNPAVLDGLNLHDDNQRLFVVTRNDEGHTRVRRIRMKPEAEQKMKLSELWLRGHLGALPQGF